MVLSIRVSAGRTVLLSWFHSFGRQRRSAHNISLRMAILKSLIAHPILSRTQAGRSEWNRLHPFNITFWVMPFWATESTNNVSEHPRSAENSIFKLSRIFWGTGYSQTQICSTDTKPVLSRTGADRSEWNRPYTFNIGFWVTPLCVEKSSHKPSEQPLLSFFCSEHPHFVPPGTLQWHQRPLQQLIAKHELHSLVPLSSRC